MHFNNIACSKFLMPSDTLCYSFIAIKGIRNTWNLADSFQDSITKILRALLGIQILMLTLS